jgi:hypothetical protein
MNFVISDMVMSSQTVISNSILDIQKVFMVVDRINTLQFRKNAVTDRNYFNVISLVYVCSSIVYELNHIIYYTENLNLLLNESVYNIMHHLSTCSNSVYELNMTDHFSRYVLIYNM